MAVQYGCLLRLYHKDSNGLLLTGRLVVRLWCPVQPYFLCVFDALSSCACSSIREWNQRLVYVGLDGAVMSSSASEGFDLAVEVAEDRGRVSSAKGDRGTHATYYDSFDALVVTCSSMRSLS